MSTNKTKFQDAEDAAVDWLIRQRDPAFQQWDAFTDWLEADPVHSRIYAEVAAIDRDLDGLPSPVIEADPATTPMLLGAQPRRLGRVAAVAVAGCVAALVGYASLDTGRDLYVVETAAGQRRTVALESGTAVIINGGSRVRFDREDPRYALLERGQAVFEVEHDPARPFAVETGGRTLIDAGTTFEVTRDMDRLNVAVSEGLVILEPRAASLRIPAGRAVALRDGESRAELRTVAPADVAAWRQDRLTYDGATLGDVAADLHRNLGVAVRATPAVARRPFRGVLLLRPELRTRLGELGPVLGVTIERVGAEWVFSERS